MIIRQATQDEWKSLQFLNNEIFIDNSKYDPDIVVDWAFSDAGEKYLQELVVDKDSVCLVAENATGRLIGYLAASPKPISYRKSKYLEVDNMGVVPQSRSKGIGLSLINACKTWAKLNGYQRLFVNSYFKNDKAINFYKKCGFQEIDISLEVDLED